MAQFNPYAQYENVTFGTANPVSLVITSYDAAIRSLKQAVVAMRENNVADRVRNIDMAYELISELRKSLNPEKGGEVAEKLNALYEFFSGELLMANAYNDPDRITPVISIMSQIRDAWSEARKKMAEE